jgi:O-succinylbenzoic acid--CoA ligase
VEGEDLFHTQFELQGQSFSSAEGLIAFSKELSAEVSLFLKEWFNEKLYVEVKTSGSTGTPKVIQLPKKQMINSALATGDFFNLPEKTTALLCMSANFIAGKMMLVRALTLGWQLDIVEPSSNPLKNIDKKYDFSAMVPLQLNNSLNEIYKIKKLIIGGGAVSKELISKLQGIKNEVFATYGMTETITHIAIKKLNNYQVENVEASHYKTLPNVLISTDKRGCLVINAPKISYEIVITNDLVELISETEFKWLGRFDTVINSGGIKLIPEQIEEKLSEIINQRFFVAGIPDIVLGEKLILIIEFKSLKVESLKVELFNRIKQLKQLNKYEIPKEIFVLDHFIVTETNKINRPKTLDLIAKN